MFSIVLYSSPFKVVRVCDYVITPYLHHPVHFPIKNTMIKDRMYFLIETVANEAMLM